MSTIYDERFELNNDAKGHIIYDEHIVRYNLACSLIKDKDVLEIACGSGYGSNMLAQAGAKKVIAMDIDDESIKKAKKKYNKTNLEFRQGNAEKIDIPDDSVDALVSFETIEHIKSPQDFLKEVRRVLRPDGIAIISTPNWEVSRAQNPFHIKEYKQGEFEELLKKYFLNTKIYKQRNALSSFIEMGEKKNQVVISSKTEPLFFLAICSDEEIQKIDKNFINLNSEALKNIYNNPGLKLVNWIYTLAIRMPGVKRILSAMRR